MKERKNFWDIDNAPNQLPELPEEIVLNETEEESDMFEEAMKAMSDDEFEAMIKSAIEEPAHDVISSPKERLMQAIQMWVCNSISLSQVVGFIDELPFEKQLEELEFIKTYADEYMEKMVSFHAKDNINE